MELSFDVKLTDVGIRLLSLEEEEAVSGGAGCVVDKPTHVWTNGDNPVYKAVVEAVSKTCGCSFPL
jgi:hypothetical protein